MGRYVARVDMFCVPIVGEVWRDKKVLFLCLTIHLCRSNRACLLCYTCCSFSVY